MSHSQLSSQSNSRSLSQVPFIVNGDPFPPDLWKNLSWHKILQNAVKKETGIVFYSDVNQYSFQSYSELLNSAQKILRGLRKQGLKPQDKVILQLRNSQQFFRSLWACFLGGFIPIPITVPNSYDYDKDKANLLIKAIELCPSALIMTEEILSSEISTFLQTQHCHHLPVITVETLLDNSPDCRHHESDWDDLMLLLLTSGSTGNPKAVMLTARNLLASVYGMANFNNLNGNDITLNWMPLEHVASLVMFHLTEVYLGCQQIQVNSELI